MIFVYELPLINVVSTYWMYWNVYWRGFNGYTFQGNIYLGNVELSGERATCYKINSLRETMLQFLICCLALRLGKWNANVFHAIDRNLIWIICYWNMIYYVLWRCKDKCRRNENTFIQFHSINLKQNEKSLLESCHLNTWWIHSIYKNDLLKTWIWIICDR